MKATSATSADPSAVVPFLKEQAHSVGHSSLRVLVCSRFTRLSRQQVPPQSQGFPPKALSFFFFLSFSEVNLRELTLHPPRRGQAEMVMAVIVTGGCHQPVLLSMIFCSLQTSADLVFLVLPFWISSPTPVLIKSTNSPML